MSLADDLRAAKALIDTPEKFDAVGRDILTALARIVRSGHETHLRLLEANDALAGGVPARFRGSVNNYGKHRTTRHADVMALFDLAISAAEAQS